MERLNELQVFRADGDRARGFKTVLVSETNHPFWEYWWPPGHIIGWGDTFVHELHHVLQAIADDTDVAPYGATFEDGYRAAVVARRDRPLRRDRPARDDLVSRSEATLEPGSHEPVHCSNRSLDGSRVSSSTSVALTPR